jgi:hypothetical protein
MRLMEGMRLRIKDVDFDRHVIIVRDAKGGKDRVVMLPRSLVPDLRLQMLAARAQWEADRQAQRGGVARRNSACAGEKIPQGWLHMGLVLDFSVAHTVHRSTQWRGTASPFVRRQGSTRAQESRAAGGHLQTGFCSYAAPLIRHAFAANWN